MADKTYTLSGAMPSKYDVSKIFGVLLPPSSLSTKDEFCAKFQMLLFWTTNQQPEIFFTAISLDAHNDNIRNLAQNSASAYQQLKQHDGIYKISLISTF